jgi:hypothetical protein
MRDLTLITKVLNTKYVVSVLRMSREGVKYNL